MANTELRALEAPRADAILRIALTNRHSTHYSVLEDLRYGPSVIRFTSTDRFECEIFKHAVETGVNPNWAVDNYRLLLRHERNVNAQSSS